MEHWTLLAMLFFFVLLLWEGRRYLLQSGEAVEAFRDWSRSTSKNEEMQKSLKEKAQKTQGIHTIVLYRMLLYVACLLLIAWFFIFNFVLFK